MIGSRRTACARPLRRPARPLLTDSAKAYDNLPAEETAFHADEPPDEAVEALKQQEAEEATAEGRRPRWRRHFQHEAEMLRDCDCQLRLARQCCAAALLVRHETTSSSTLVPPLMDPPVSPLNF